MSDATNDHLQDQLDLDQVKTRSVTGIVAITVRTFVLQLFALVANFLLTIFLLPGEYGIFFAVAALVDFFVIFSDVGLAAALIQKQTSLEEKDLRTTFTVQQILVNILVVIALLLSPLIAQFYHLSAQGLWLFRALAVSLSLASFKTIPAIRLERQLKFSQLIIPQLIENIVFYTTAVILAWKGAGVTSFTVAVLLRSITGLIAIYILSPWVPKFYIDRQALKKLFSFGIPFQLNTVIAFVKDKLIVAYLFKVLSPAEVGFIAWGQKWSHYPLQLVMDSLNKVTFPSYSRLQSQKKLLKKAIDKSVFFIALLIFPAVVGIMATAASFVRLIPRYQQWQPAVIVLILFSITALWSSVSTTLTNALAAMGKIRLNLKLMILWTTLTWILTPILVYKLGYTGAALASALIAFTSILPIIIVNRLVKTRIISTILPSLLNALTMGIVVFYLATKVNSLFKLLVVIIFGAILYAILALITQGTRLKQEVARLVQIILAKDKT